MAIKVNHWTVAQGNKIEANHWIVTQGNKIGKIFYILIVNKTSTNSSLNNSYIFILLRSIYLQIIFNKKINK